MVRNLAQYANAYNNGCVMHSPFYKSSVPVVGAGLWADLSMGAGTPKFNAYVGGQLEATPLSGVGNTGLYLGSYNGKKYIHRLIANSNTANSAPYFLQLCDYLMFYPLVDLDSLDLQEMDNTQFLTRSADGVGVRVMVVLSSPMAAACNCTVNYINQNGDEKSVTFTLLSSSVLGAIISTASTQSTSNTAITPFMPLAAGDTGVRRITSVQMVSSAGGFATFVLVKPLIRLQLQEISIPNEVEPVRQMAQMKEVEGGACLNFIGLQGGTGTVTALQGILETVNIGE